MKREDNNIQIKPSKKKGESMVSIILENELTIFSIETMKDKIIDAVNKYSIIEFILKDVSNMDFGSPAAGELSDVVSRIVTITGTAGTVAMSIGATDWVASDKVMAGNNTEVSLDAGAFVPVIVAGVSTIRVPNAREKMPISTHFDMQLGAMEAIPRSASMVVPKRRANVARSRR